jgi:alpha-tubulin suppressor-like RCC1 family protein
MVAAGGDSVWDSYSGYYVSFVCRVDTIGSVGCLYTGYPDLDYMKKWTGVFEPKLLGLDDMVSITAGESHACALGKGGEVWCWGAGKYGQLGDGTGEYQFTPVLVELPLGVIQLEAGAYHTCATAEDGTAWCWGRNEWGQLGNGTKADSLVPTPVVGLVETVAVTGGWTHSCAVTENGAAWCWGENQDGQLGDGSAWRTVPVKVLGIP